MCLFHDFGEAFTGDIAESRLYRAMDKIEALIQHDEADIATWLPLEYELQFTYGAKESAAFPYIKLLREEIDCITKEKIKNKKSPIRG